ncbi:GIY-YIG nuclease family protein [Microcoleus sp. LAD1_D5]|uniref:GIY-YIG nuclease family protein n=1 Tax=unclassified Microcoleus TaxID=2642155 RepID=UPI002FD1E3C2
MSNRNTAVLRVLETPKAGYIYLVQAVGTPRFKIGKTQISVLRRINELQTGCPLKIRYVYHACVEEMNRIEKELHSKFSSSRVIGEWFSLTHEQVSECIQLMQLVQCDESILLPIENEIVEEEAQVALVAQVAELVGLNGAILPEDVRSIALSNILRLLSEAGSASDEVIKLIPVNPDMAVWRGIQLLGKSMTAVSRDIFNTGTGGAKFNQAKLWYEELKKLN